MLNFSISISFIPYFEHNPDHWPPMPYSPISFDEIVARVDTADRSKYIITPNDTRNKEVKHINFERDHPDDSPYIKKLTFFYVSSEQFATYQEELLTLAEHIGSGVYSFSPASKIQQLSFVRFLQDIVIKSEHFDVKDKRLLCR
ncbi:MAG TPA: hypothetical protein VFS21_34760 [Roseiflexaceae bacterium]|nr:hypothetical protein [Roseiflexaceae bacterium]